MSDGDGVEQPPIELVVGAPLQIRQQGGDTLVGYCSRTGFRTIKRF